MSSKKKSSAPHFGTFGLRASTGEVVDAIPEVAGHPCVWRSLDAWNEERAGRPAALICLFDDGVEGEKMLEVVKASVLRGRVRVRRGPRKPVVESDGDS